MKSPNDIWKGPFTCPSGLQIRSANGIAFLDIRGWGHLTAGLKLSDDEAGAIQDAAISKVIRILNEHWEDTL
jgi:hypothetical protein